MNIVELQNEDGQKWFEQVFKDLGGWPTLVGSEWAHPNENQTWEQAVGIFLQKTGLDGTLIEVDVTFDQKNSSVYKIEVIAYCSNLELVILMFHFSLISLLLAWEAHYTTLKQKVLHNCRITLS